MEIQIYSWFFASSITSKKRNTTFLLSQLSIKIKSLSNGNNRQEWQSFSHSLSCTLECSKVRLQFSVSFIYFLKRNCDCAPSLQWLFYLSHSLFHCFKIYCPNVFQRKRTVVREKESSVCVLWILIALCALCLSLSRSICPLFSVSFYTKIDSSCCLFNLWPHCLSH